MKTAELRTISVTELRPAEYNPRVKLQPGDKEYEDIKRSIQRFGFADPIVVNSDMTIIGGHQRLNVAKDLGYKEVPCAVVDLSKPEEQALNVALNKMGGRFDDMKLGQLLKGLSIGGFDTTLTGYTNKEKDELINGLTLNITASDDDGGHFWGEQESKSTDEYEQFLDKFKQKLTTDDCYTPQNIYEAVKRWAQDQYDLGDCDVVRPFYPCGDYTTFEYSDTSLVIDNPPFSIISEICRFYVAHGVKFFLFAPSLTLFSIASGEVNYLPVGANVTYENGANVATSFVTNLGEYKIDTAPSLFTAIKEENDKNMRELHKELPSYTYPDCVLCGQIAKIAKYGQELRIKASDMRFIRALEDQTQKGKAIYGGGILISEKAAAEKAAAEKAAAEKAAAEKAAAEKAAAEKWTLSESEREIIRELGDEMPNAQERHQNEVIIL